MRQRNQTRRVGDAGDKAARTSRKADAALSAVHREAQARLYRQQWRSPPSVAPSKRRFGAAPTAGISIGGASAAWDAAIAGRPRRPPNRRSTAPKPALYTLRNRFPAQTRPSLYARAQRQAARRHCKVNEGFCASRKLFHRFAVRLAVGRRLYSDFPVLSSTGERLIKSYIAALFRSTA